MSFTKQYFEEDRHMGFLVGQPSQMLKGMISFRLLLNSMKILKCMFVHRLHNESNYLNYLLISLENFVHMITALF